MRQLRSPLKPLALKPSGCTYGMDVQRCFQDINRKQGIHRSGTEALEVQRDIGETQGLENSREFARHLRGQRLGQSLRERSRCGRSRRDGARGTGGSPSPGARLRPFPPVQSASRVTGRPYSIRLDRHAEAGLSHTRRFSPARASSRISVLVSPACSKGATTPCLPGSFLTWTKISLVIHVHAVRNYCCSRALTANSSITEKSSSLQWKHRIASLRRYSALSISAVMTTRSGNRHLFGEGEGVAHLCTCQAGRIRQHGQHLVAQHAVCHVGEIGGIDSAGVRDQQPSQRTQVLLKQRVAFRAATIPAWIGAKQP